MHGIHSARSPQTLHQCSNQVHVRMQSAVQDDLVFLLNNGKHYTLAELLPVRFRPSDLLDESVTPLLLQQQSNSLHLRPGACLFLLPAYNTTEMVFCAACIER